MHWPVWRATVAERSMEPGLQPGDLLLVWRGFRAGRPPRIRPGRVVVARHPARHELLLVKRAERLLSDGWWLASDNPDAGAVDSRSFGPVSAQLVEGRMLDRYRHARPTGPDSRGE